MAEIMNTNMELAYFAWIMENPNQFSKVEPYFFKKDEIQFVYNVIREEYIKSPKKVIPTVSTLPPSDSPQTAGVNSKSMSITKPISQIFMQQGM
jgi:hypothetical protein